MKKVVFICLLLSGCSLSQIKDAEVVYCNPILQAGRTVARAGLTAVTGVHMVDVCETIDEMTQEDEA
tara:strand:- start:448 stop:648 length:201 start_codon:yes stop_codon:yes gene_type:complete